MIAGVLEAGGLAPESLNGRVMKVYNSNAHLGTGDWLTGAADESDDSFLRLPRLILVVTNIDSDHIVFWTDQCRTRWGFAQFVRNVPFYGFGVLCLEYK